MKNRTKVNSVNGICMSMGMCFGVTFGAVCGDVAKGIVIGLLIGIGVAAVLRSQMKNDA